MKMPSFTVDKEALKKGIWGNTWKAWGVIALAFTGLYLVEAGYFTGLLFAAEEIRGKDYKSLVSTYFGKFETQNIPAVLPLPGAPAGETFNRPEGCVAQTASAQFGEKLSFSVPNGIQICTPTKDNTAWSIFPWVADTNGAGNFPGCAAAAGATVITAESSPAFVGSGIAGPSGAARGCQNFVPLS